MEKKNDNKRNSGDFKKTELKKIPFRSLFILIDRCPSRPSTMTATATSRNVNYLPWRCTTTTWNVLISRSVEYLNVRQRFLFLFLNFDRDLWNLTPKKELCQHLANWTRWNKGDTRNKVWNAAWMQFLRACGVGGGGGGGWAVWYGNGPLSWGDPPVHIICHFNSITFTW